MRLPAPPEKYDPNYERQKNSIIEQTLDRLHAKGRDVELDKGESIRLYAPGGVRYKLSVSDAGLLTLDDVVIDAADANTLDGLNSTAFAQVASNLADLTDKAAARTNLSLVPGKAIGELAQYESDAYSKPSIIATGGGGFIAKNNSGTWFEAHITDDSISDFLRVKDSAGNTVAHIEANAFNGAGGGYVSLEQDWRIAGNTIPGIVASLINNDNGWIEWASGLMEQWGMNRAGYTTVDTSDFAITTSFHKTFNAAPHVNFNILNDTDFGGGENFDDMQVKAITINDFTINLQDESGGSVFSGIAWYARGRWK